MEKRVSDLDVEKLNITSEKDLDQIENLDGSFEERDRDHQPIEPNYLKWAMWPY